MPIEGGNLFTPPKEAVPVKNGFANVTSFPDEDVPESIGSVFIVPSVCTYLLSVRDSNLARKPNSWTEILCAADSDSKVALNLNPLPL